MNMTDITFFLKVIECGSFSKAAEELFVSQQAVSLHIKHLEETYNTVLFERRPALKLTHAGTLLKQAAEDIQRRENLLVDELKVSHSDFYGEITIGLPANRSTAFACEFVPRFSALYPNVSVSLKEQYSSELSSGLMKNTLDLALPLISHTTAPLDTSFLEAIPLESETIYIVISDDLLREAFPGRYPDCREEFLSGVSLYDFARLPLFLHPSNSAFHREILNAIRAHGIKPFLRIQTALTSSLVEPCAKGYGVYFSPSMLLQYMYQSQPSYFLRLNMFPVRELQGIRHTYLAYHRQKALNKPLQDAIEIIKRIYSEHHLFDLYIQRSRADYAGMA